MSSNLKNEPILIIGAGVFGLTTALHLSKSGYKDVHLFDKQPFHETNYSFSLGSDGASSDENKILRASYGGQDLYQNLAFSAMESWEQWNEDIATSAPEDLPEALRNTDKIWDRCGFLRVGETYDQHEIDTQANFPESKKHTQYRISSPSRRKAATASGIPPQKFDPFGREPRGLKMDGVLDMTGGYTLASKACTYALHLCLKAGVHTHFGASHEFKSFLREGTKVTGITTATQTHKSSLVILATGGWTPSLLPPVSNLLETTSGSVITIALPPHRTDLWHRYSPQNFPVWSWKMETYQRGTSVGGLYGFPRTPEGIIKFGFRGAKWTNYTFATPDGTFLSYPKTDLEEVPQHALDVVKSFCKENLPDLLELDLQRGRLCWYTDSVNNSFLIDRVPGMQGLVVASGGSGHGFKFLPVLGRHVVDVVEGTETEYTRLFAWRDVPEGKRNGLEEGREGWRTLDKQKLVGRREWKL